MKKKQGWVMIFSVIIPHYNSFETLERLILSIPEWKEIQIIVVDDKSEEAERYNLLSDKYSKRENVTFLRNESERKGAGTCRNIGLEYALGTWILFADADDYFMPKAFDNLIKFQDTEEDIIYFPPTSVDSESGILADRHVDSCNMVDYFLRNNNRLSENLLRYFWSTPWSKLIRADLIKKYDIRFDELIVSNDVMFSMKTGFYAETVTVSDDVIYVITKSVGTLTTTKSKLKLFARVDVNMRRYKFLKEKMTQPEFEELGLCGANWVLAAIRGGYGIGTALVVIYKYVSNRVPLLNKYMVRNYRILYGERTKSR